MGLCSSCCGRRHKQPKDSDDPERRPLLRADSAALQNASTPYEKVVDAMAAFKAGKLPTQEQLDKALRALLKSGVLDAEAGRKGGALNEASARVVKDTRELVEALLRFGLETNGDDKIQDLVYQVRQLSAVPMDVKRPPQVNIDDSIKTQVDVAASTIPSQEEVASDTAALLSSITTLSRIVITSSTFRAILADLLLTARETIASSVEKVRKAAETVEQISEAVETTIKPELESNFAKRVGGDEQPIIEERIPKEVALDRLEEIFVQAQASPQYNSALRVILYIFQKYATRVSVIASSFTKASESSSTTPNISIVAPVIVPDPRFRRALEDAKVLIERLASGRSLDTPLQSLFQAIQRVNFIPDGGKSNEVQLYFRKVGKWLDNALTDSKYVSSREGREAATMLYDEGQVIFTRDTNLSKLLDKLLGDIQDIIDGIKMDTTTRTLLNTVHKLQVDLVELTGHAAQKTAETAIHWRATVLRAALGWILPKVLRAIRVLPMPRVEFVSQESSGSRLAVAVDALLMSAQESLLPDILTVQEFAEIRVEMDERLGAAELTSPNSRLLDARRDLEQGTLDDQLLENGQNGYGTSLADTATRRETLVQATTRMRLHIEGLRISAHDVGYYASYSVNSWLGYEDEGLLSVDIGRGFRRGDGLSLDIEVEVEADSVDSDSSDSTSSAKDKQLFRVLNVTSSFPGLCLHLSKSKHWILNNLIVSPFAGPIGRLVTPMILNVQVRAGLEALERLLRDAKGRVEETALRRGNDSTPDVSDWWEGILESFKQETQNDNVDSDEDDEDDDDGEGEIPMHTETEIGTTLTGIYRTTVTKPDVDIDSPADVMTEDAPTTESTLAVGLGAQLLPGKAEQAVMDVSRETPREAAHDVTSSAREAIVDLQRKAVDAVSETQDAAMKGMEEAAESRRVAKRGMERMKKQEGRERKKRGWRSRVFDVQ